MKGTPLQRFLAKVTPEPMTGCWLWTAALNSGGYGLFAFGPNKRLVLAHRWAYQLVHRELPDELDHVCNQRCCVNPRHLRPTTHRANMARSSGPVGANARKTHCVRGHAFTPENTYVRPEGRGRQCRACMGRGEVRT
jgi:hypothetical protein